MSSSSFAIRINENFFESFAERSFSIDSFIREALTNSYEADASRVEVHISQNGDIFIEDWGTGMSEQDIRQFWEIGTSQKKGTVSSRYHRPRRGMFGIGKLALHKAFKVIKVQTKKGAFDLTLVADEGSLRTKELKVAAEKPLDHDGVKISAQGRKKHDFLLTEKGFVYYVQSRLADLISDRNFELYVNAKKVEPLTAKGLKSLVNVNERVPGLGPVSGTIEIVRRGRIPKEIQGIQVTVSGGGIGGRTLFGCEAWGHGFSRDRITGSIECPGLETAIQYSRDSFDEASIEYTRFKDTVVRVMRTQIKSALDAQRGIELSRLAAEVYRDFVSRLDDVLEKEKGFRLIPLETAREQAPQPAAGATQQENKASDTVLPLQLTQGVAVGGDEKGGVAPLQAIGTSGAVSQPAELASSLPISTGDPGETSLAQPLNPLMEQAKEEEVFKVRVHPRRVAGWLIDFVEMDRSIPAIRERDIIYINPKYPGFTRMESKEAMFHYIARVVTQEIVKNFTQKSDEAFEQQNKLLTQIYIAND